MRAPQYGHSKFKRRGSQTRLPPTPKLWRAVGLRGPNEPVPTRRIRYLAPKQVKYLDGDVGAACTMSLHHKNADLNLKARKAAFGSDYRRGPKATKRYAELENTHRAQGLIP